MNLSQKGKSNQTAKWIFYRVKDFDRNRNNKIDEKDPNILYISDVYGENLKALTSNDENVVDFDIFEDQNFVLIKKFSATKIMMAILRAKTKIFII
jgi:5,10-methenyltetrahydromethanopterin hydrogenase